MAGGADMGRRIFDLLARRSALLIAAAVLLPSLAGAVTGSDYYQGIEAYKRGRHGTAYAKLLPYAQRGIASVQTRIGLMTYLGQGVAADKAKAAQWYAKAALKGAGEAQWRLGDMYLRGDGVAGNPALAAWWLERAANQGYGAAQYNMAYLYISGKGVPQDAVRAHAWLTRALAQDYRPAAELRARLGRAMSADEVARATRLAHGQVASHVGSGVLINRAGQVLTAFHLVDGCRKVTTIGEPPRQALTLVGYDLANDLALMKLARPSRAAVPISWDTALRDGQAIYHAGLSMNGTEAPRLSFGKGRLRRLQGPNGDRRFIGLAAGMADGNAGGPVLDRRGRLIGISLDRPRLMALTGAAETQAWPLHYALNAAVLRDFLDYYDVATGDVATGVAADAGPVLDDAGAVARLRAVTVGFECRL